MIHATRRSRLGAAVLVVTLVAALAACGNTSPTASRSTTVLTPAPTVAPVTAPPTTAATTTTTPPTTSAPTTAPPTTSPPTTSPPSAAGQVAADAANGLTKGWVHATGDVDGGAWLLVAGTASGTMSLTIKGQTLSLVELPGVVYAKGTAPILIAFLKMPQAAARTAAGKWVRLVPRDSEYGNVGSFGLSLIGLMASIQIEPPGQETKAGGNLVVTGTGKSTNGAPTFKDVLTTGSPGLPVSWGFQQNGTDEHLVFSQWGQNPNVKAPAGAIGLP